MVELSRSYANEFDHAGEDWLPVMAVPFYLEEKGLDLVAFASFGPMFLDVSFGDCANGERDYIHEPRNQLFE